MKCDLSQVWKRELQHIESIKLQGIEAAKIEQRKEKQKIEIEKLKSLGWVFSDINQNSPYHGEDWSSMFFLSPRMFKPAKYELSTNFIVAEAKYLANRAYEECSYELKNKFLKEAQEFYMQFRDTTTFPAYNISLEL